MLKALHEDRILLKQKSLEEAKARKRAEEQEQEAIYLLGRVSDIRDEGTGLHLKRIGELSMLLGRLLGLDQNQQELLYKSSPLHDIGKIGISEAILLKPAKLTTEEISIMKEHAKIGYDLLKGSKSAFLQKGAEIALTHHERWDGRGYPSGLKGTEIPIFGRIVSIVDVLDALLSDRPYKKAWSAEDVFSYITEQRARHFDPELVDLVTGNFTAFSRHYSLPAGLEDA